MLNSVTKYLTSDSSSCFGDLSDCLNSLNALNSMKALLHLEKIVLLHLNRRDHVFHYLECANPVADPGFPRRRGRQLLRS